MKEVATFHSVTEMNRLFGIEFDHGIPLAEVF
jgi:hypothetical protein